MVQWIYLQNPFANATENSFRKAVLIAQKHLSYLDAYKNDADILQMYNLFQPLNDGLNNVYDQFIAHMGTQESETMTVNENLRLLSNPKIRQWDVRIQTVYAEDSPEYKALLPNGRRPFQTGASLMRINAMNILSKAIGSNALLATLKTEVDVHYQQTNTAYSDQQGALSRSRGLSEKVDIARIAACTGMYKNLARLMDKYATTPQEVEKFFPLDLIRNAQQVDFKRKVNEHSIRFVVKRTLTQGDKVRLVNDGNTDLWFYLAKSKTSQPGSLYTLVNSHTEQTVNASVLGDLSNSYLMCYNPDMEQQGHFTLELK